MPTLKQFIKSKWFRDRPRSIQEAARKYPPGIYRLKTTDQTVALYCYEEPNEKGPITVKVDVIEGKNCGFRVFGISLEDLEPINILK